MSCFQPIEIAIKKLFLQQIVVFNIAHSHILFSLFSPWQDSWNKQMFNIFFKKINHSFKSTMSQCRFPLHWSTLCTVWLDWAIYWTLGNFSNHVATIILPKLPTFKGNFCKGVQNLSFFQWNHFWATLIDIWRLFNGHTACVELFEKLFYRIGFLNPITL